MKRHHTIMLLPVLFCFFFLTRPCFAVSNILFLLDGSGSMWGKVDGEYKIAIAKEVMTDLIQDLPEGLHLGLGAYGHRRKGDCNDIEILVPMGEGEKSRLLKQIQAISPKGKTPITKSLAMVAEQLQTLEGETTVVLVSDGKETCEGDPCQLVTMYRQRGINLRVHVVGFDVTMEILLFFAWLAALVFSSGGSMIVVRSIVSSFDHIYT